MTFRATATGGDVFSHRRASAVLHRQHQSVYQFAVYGRQGVDCESIRGQNIPGFSWRLRLRHAANPPAAYARAGRRPFTEDFARRPAARPRIATAPARRRMTPPLRLAVGEGWRSAVDCCHCCDGARHPAAMPRTFCFPGKTDQLPDHFDGIAASSTSHVCAHLRPDGELQQPDGYAHRRYPAPVPQSPPP